MMASRLDAVSLLRFAASSFACVSFACLSVASLSRFIVDASLLAALAVLDRLYIACRNARSPAAPIRPPIERRLREHRREQRRRRRRALSLRPLSAAYTRAWRRPLCRHKIGRASCRERG